MKSIQSKNIISNNFNHSPFFKKGNSDFSPGRKNRPFFNAFPIQAKLTVNEPGDQYEKEADSMADKVVQRLSDKSFSGAEHNSTHFFNKPYPSVQTKCAACEQEEKLQKKEKADEERILQGRLQKKPIFESNAESPEDKNIQRKCTDCEKEEKLQKKANSSDSLAVSPGIESNLNSSKGSGSLLSPVIRKQMENSFGADFSDVRLHTDNYSVQMNKDLNAQAFTHGSDIYFNSGKYNTNHTAGKHLLAHELTHVVQQENKIKRKDILQRNLAQSIPTSNGVFGIDMQTQTFAANNKTGMTGTIDFLPGQTSPYSNEIPLIQISRTINADTGVVVTPVGMTGTSGTNVLLTQNNPLTGVEGGFKTDVLHNQAGTFQDMPLSPRYRFGTLNLPGGGQCFGGGPQIIGFKRSDDPDDIHEAKLADCPGIQNNTSNFDFSFETVAKGTDTNFIYGSLKWGFKARAGAVTDERVQVSDNQSGTFDEALTRHQNFYTHEPVVFYFDFDKADLSPSEQAKLDLEVISYLKRFADVRITISGFADRRGGVSYNLDLANRRANKVAQLFMLSGGVSADRINPLNVTGSTESFTSDAITDQDKEANRRGNRRVTVVFEHTATVPLPGQI